MGDTTSRHCQGRSGRTAYWGLAIVGAIILLLLVVGTVVSWRLQSLREARQRRAKAELADQLAEIRAGRSDLVYLYCSSNTDDLLGHLAGRPEVERLRLDLTDVSDAGMVHVATLRNLKKLIIYGGGPGVGDTGLSRLKTLTNLENLQLINTHVTDQGLSVLKDFPSLRHLTLFDEAWRGPTLTKAAIVHLKELTSLQELELSGAWISENELKELRQSLPNCSIATESNSYPR